MGQDALRCQRHSGSERQQPQQQQRQQTLVMTQSSEISSRGELQILAACSYVTLA